MSTRCRTVDELIAAFATLVDEHSLVVLTDQQRVIGSRQPFVIELADGTMVMKGEAEVVESTAPPKGRLRLKFLALDAGGREIHKRMLDRKGGGNGQGRPTTDAGMKPLVRIPAKKEESEKAAAAKVAAGTPLPAPLPPIEPRVERKASPPLAPRTPQPTPIATIPVIAPRSPTRMGMPAVGRLPMKKDGVSAETPAPVKPVPAPEPAPESPSLDDEKTNVDTRRDAKAPEPAPSAGPEPGPSTGSGAAPRPSTGSGLELGERVPGSPYVLPANPFGELAPQQLEAFVECTLYEETGQFEVPEMIDSEIAKELGLDEIAEPPAAATPPPTPTAPPAAAADVPDWARAETQLAKPADARPKQPTDVTPLIEIARRPLPWIILGGLLVFGLLIGIVASRLGRDDEPVASVAPDAGVVAKAVTPPAAVPDAAPAVVVAPPDASPEDPTAEPEEEEPLPVVTPVEPPTGDCELSVVVEPRRAPVYLDARPLGNAPIRTAIPCEPARVVVSHPRYERIEKKIRPKAGKPVELTLDLERMDMRLTIASRPAGATIEINGRVVGKAPVTTKVKAFTTATVEARRDGYLTWSEKVYFKKNQPKITAKLKKAIRKKP